jgi:hypothetical protein
MGWESKAVVWGALDEARISKSEIRNNIKCQKYQIFKTKTFCGYLLSLFNRC